MLANGHHGENCKRCTEKTDIMPSESCCRSTVSASISTRIQTHIQPHCMHRTAHTLNKSIIHDKNDMTQQGRGRRWAFTSLLQINSP